MIMKYGTHMPMLMRAVSLTSGPILEMGGGFNSTPYLHWLCWPNRELVTYETNEKFFKELKSFNSNYHKVLLIKNWDEANIKRQWDVVLIDHSPAERRRKDIEILSNLAKYLIVHDTEDSIDSYYKYSEVYQLFKYKYRLESILPNTSVLSNFSNVAEEFKDIR